jgi:DNA replication licensing factor MCM4
MADGSQPPNSQTQDDSQLRIDDHFGSTPSSETFTSSLLADPSSYYSHTVAYGTNINVPAVAGEIRKFMQLYVDESEGSTPIYLRKIQEMAVLDDFNLSLDTQHLAKFNSILYGQFVAFPLEMIQIADTVVKEIFQSLYPSADNTINLVQVRPFNLAEVKSVREMEPSDIDRLVAVRGMVTRVSGLIPDMTEAALKCRHCGHIERFPVANGRITEPAKCNGCGTANAYDVDHRNSLFTDRQHLKIQESPESVPQGETPQTLNAIIFEDLVDYARPGDRVEITGIWRAVPARVNPRIRTLNAVYRTYVDVVHVRKQFAERIEAEGRPSFDETTRTQQYEEQRRASAIELSSDPDIYDKLVRSFAPSIWEMEEVKKGLLCLLFGGSGREEKRADINILLIGDPATAKSQLLQYSHRVAPRGLYTSGKGSSAVGLTASVVRDSETGEFVLESGALVLSDRGVCCIDEFDKMSDAARSVLHEAMEQQTVSVAKAGIVCTLNARASIVACANPRDSSYNQKLSVVENIRLPPTLLSRFDLVYLVLDKVDAERDQRLARHIVSLYTTKETIEGVIPAAKLTEYIAFAKETCFPEFTDEAQEVLINGYIEMRALGGRHVVSATPRQLESCIRLAEAHAKMRLSPTVEPHDAEEALKLMQEALHQAATDPTTGLIDMD